MHRGLRGWIAVAALGAAAVVGQPAAAATTAPVLSELGLAELAGERLEYRVRWGALVVARATLEVEAAGEGKVVLRATARSRGWIDPLYPVRERVESTVETAVETAVEMGGMRPLRYFKDSKEGHGRRELVEVELDWAARVARYQRRGEAREPLALPLGVQDPLSCLYAYRLLAAAGAGEVSLAVTDGKRVTAGSFRDLRRERVRTPAGEFDAVVVEPAIEGLGGVFRKSPKKRILIWFTDDRWRRPVRFLAEVAVGRFTMELVGLEHGPGSQDAGSPAARPQGSGSAG